MGTVVVPGLLPYRITSEDKLWAARAAQFEGGHDPLDVLWTWTQRHATPRMRRNFPQLYQLIQAHSQPVNPIWKRDGSRCRPGGQYHGTEHCSEPRLRNRDRAASISFRELQPEIQEAVRKWAAGQAPNPVPRSVDFAAPTVAQSFLSRVPGSRLLKRAGNWFIGTRESLAWPDGHVQIQGGGLSDAPILPIAVGAASAAFILGTGYYYWKSL